MKKKNRILTALTLLLALAISITPAMADTFTGDSGWTVEFTAENKMESNFTAAGITDVISGLQPGDSAVLVIALKNSNTMPAEWFMTNKVLYSLEDRSANSKTGGGAYSYVLRYEGPGQSVDIFNSDTVGGSGSQMAGEGLHQATNALEDYFYMDTLAPGESGQLTLEVKLEGETQGNDYQSTLADLQLNFAAAPVASNTTTGGSKFVKTGDSSNPLTYMGLMAVSGMMLCALATYGLVSSKKDKMKVSNHR